MQCIGICPAVLALELEAEYLITAEWDYFQRLLLLLRSDASLKTDQCRRWTGRQVSALAAVAAFVVGVLLLGFGWQLLLLTIPLGVVSMAISCWPSGEGEAETDAEATDFVRLTPYSSASEMLAVHRTVPNFRKR